MKLCLIVLLVILITGVKGYSYTADQDAQFITDVTNSVNGDEFLLGSGVYTINTLTTNVNITIRGTQPGVIIECTNNITGGITAGSHFTFQDLTIRNCSSALALTATVGTSKYNIKSIIFERNTAGIQLEASSLFSIVLENSSFSFHSGIALSIVGSFANGGSFQIRDCRFYNNTLVFNSNISPMVVRQCTGSITNSTFEYNEAQNGGAVQLSYNTDTIFDSCNFFSNRAKSGGSVYINPESSVLFKNCNFTSNSAISYGGALYASDLVKNNTLDSCNCEMNSAPFGGCVYGYTTPINIFSSSINNNRASNGGGLYLSSEAVATISSTTFAFNKATLAGGGTMFNVNCSFIITDCLFHNNSGAIGGGMNIEAQTDSQIRSLKNVTFSENYAGGFSISGGAISSSISTFSVSSSTFLLNSASNGGAAMYLYRTTCSINSSTSTQDTGIAAVYIDSSNSVLISGGTVKNSTRAFYIVNSGVRIESSKIIQNNLTKISTAQTGAAMDVYSSSITLIKTTVADNDANKGGGLALSSTSATVVGLICEHNIGRDIGGCIYGTSNSAINMSDSSISDNQALTSGGGIAIQNISITIINSNFSRNTAASGGALFSANPSDIFVSRGLFRWNSAGTAGGAVLLNYTGAVIDFSTFFGNNANSIGGAIFIQSERKILLGNNTIVNNTAPSSSGIFIGSTTTVVRTSIIENDNSNIKFCCNSALTNSPDSENCSYPTCSPGCSEAFGCSCPFSSPSFVYGDFEDLASVNTTCTCQTGFSGPQCNQFDCAYSNCSKTEGYCESGTDGDFTCHCNSGYENIYNCTDINECEQLDGCSAANSMCANKPGGFDCLCMQGFNGTYPDCVDIDECATRQYNCTENAKCNNTIGNYTCECLTGFSGDPYSNCSDINECSYNNTCYQNVTCTNHIGNYSCGICPVGFSGTGIGIIGCSSICISTSCDPLTACTNITGGGFNCSSCPSGYSGTGLTGCQNKNECENGDAKCSVDANCNDGPGYYNCSCKSGFIGDGYNCTDINECEQNNTICELCRNYIGGFECTNCGEGFTAQNGTCIGIANCNVNNGGCDVHVTCSSINGNRSCGSCPLGYSGSGYNVCIALCGDGKCDPLLQETCVSCPRDCGTSLCNVCGDGSCNTTIGETCSSCYEDCKDTCVKPCPACSVHGTCVNGLCVCSGSWTGALCDVNREPIVVVTNTSQPSVIIQPTDTSTGIKQQVVFSIGIQNLVEKNANGETIKTIELNGMEYNYTMVDTAFVNGSKNQMWQYVATLENKAIVNITFIQFIDESTNYSFFDESSIFVANTLKVNFRVENWPFNSISNTLEVYILSSSSTNSNSGCTSTSESLEQDGYLQWLRVTISGVELYAQFVPTSVVDDRKRITKFTQISNSIVSATIPHFWDFAEFDPHYSVLIDPVETGDNVDECGNLIASEKSKSNIGKIVGISVGVVAGVSAVAVGAIFFVIKNKRKKTLKRLKKGPVAMDKM